MSRRESITRNREAILELAARHGATNVRLFGSVARGDDDADSDVDVIVKLESDRSLVDLGDLVMDLRDLLDAEVNVITEHKDMRPHFCEELAREAVAL